MRNKVKGNPSNNHNCLTRVRNKNFETKKLCARGLCQGVDPHFFNQWPITSMNETPVANSNVIGLKSAISPTGTETANAPPLVVNKEYDHAPMTSLDPAIEIFSNVRIY